MNGKRPLHVTEMLQSYVGLMQIWTRKGDPPPPRFPLSFLVKASVTGRVAPACPFVLKVLIFLYVIICIVYYCYFFVFKEKKKVAFTLKALSPACDPVQTLGSLRSILAKSWQYVHCYKHRSVYNPVLRSCGSYLRFHWIFAIRGQIRGIPIHTHWSKQTSNPKTRPYPLLPPVS